MARKQNDDENIQLPVLGADGEPCGACGTPLAPDQRYCLNCGDRRGGPRLAFDRFMGGGQPAPVPAGGPSLAATWSPITAIGAIAVLGIMLLLGVLIGKDDEPQQVASSEPVVVQGTPTTDTAATTAAATPAADKGDKAKAAEVPGQGDVVQGGSGSTEGIATADTNASALENAKNAPDQVATDGEKAPLDPGGQAGGGSDAVCIGC